MCSSHECAGDRVDGQVPLLVIVLSVLADLLAALDHVVKPDVQDAAVQVDVADLHGAQLTAAHAGDRDEPHVQRKRVLPAGAGLLDHLHDRGRRGGLPSSSESRWAV